LVSQSCPGEPCTYIARLNSSPFSPRSARPCRSYRQLTGYLLRTIVPENDFARPVQLRLSVHHEAATPLSLSSSPLSARRCRLYHRLIGYLRRSILLRTTFLKPVMHPHSSNSILAPALYIAAGWNGQRVLPLLLFQQSHALDTVAAQF
jgi:hypothetical protein